MDKVINKSDLIDKLSSECRMISDATIEEATKQVLDLMADTLAQDGRVEIRGFGSFQLHHRKPRMARNPKTGEKVAVESTAIPHFKPGKALRDAVNDAQSS